MIQSFSVLRKDRKLVLFPVLSALFGLALVALCFYSQWSDRLWNRSEPSGRIGLAGYIVLFLAYCSFNTVMIFCNCALAACAQIRFAGDVPSLADGWRRAASRIRPIMVWAFLSATLGLVMQAIAERVGFLGKIVTWLLGFAWGLVTYLMVPVLVLEHLDVQDSIRRSSGLLRGTWGEQLVSNIYLGWIFLLFAIPGVVLGVLGHSLSFGLAPAVLYFVALLVVLTAVQGIFEVALYRYAVSGQSSAGYSTSLLKSAFRPR